MISQRLIDTLNELRDRKDVQNTATTNKERENLYNLKIWSTITS